MLEKMKGINNKFEQNKGQYNLDRQTDKISALSSGHVSKYDFLIGKGILPKENFIQKVAGIKRFEYDPLGKELKKETSVAEKHYHKFDNDFESSKGNKSKQKSKRSCAKSNLS